MKLVPWWHRMAGIFTITMLYWLMLPITGIILVSLSAVCLIHSIVIQSFMYVISCFCFLVMAITRQKVLTKLKLIDKPDLMKEQYKMIISDINQDIVCPRCESNDITKNSLNILMCNKCNKTWS